MPRLPHALLLDIAASLPCPAYAELANRHGVPYNSVYVAARRLRRAGGLLCPLHIRPCGACGLMMAARTRHQRYHPACRRAMQSARLGGHYAHRQAQTKATATRSRVAWTGDEDRYVLEHAHASAHAIALALGRSLAAIINRRKVLSEQ
jgi:hypothetical protein